MNHLKIEIYGDIVIHYVYNTVTGVYYSYKFNSKENRIISTSLHSEREYSRNNYNVDGFINYENKRIFELALENFLSFSFNSNKQYKDIFEKRLKSIKIEKGVFEPENYKWYSIIYKNKKQYAQFENNDIVCFSDDLNTFEVQDNFISSDEIIFVSTEPVKVKSSGNYNEKDFSNRFNIDKKYPTQFYRVNKNCKPSNEYCIGIAYSDLIKQTGYVPDFKIALYSKSDKANFFGLTKKELETHLKKYI